MRSFLGFLAMLVAVPAVAAPTYSIGDATVSEAAGKVTLVISKSGGGKATYSTLWVNTVDTGQTATAGIDFRAISQSVQVNPSQSSVTVSVPIIARAGYQPSRSFQVKIAVLRYGAIGHSPATVTIIDTSLPPPPPTGVVWTKCADEGQICYVASPTDVRYGKGITWSPTFQETASFACNNSLLGGDPLVGTVKECDITGIPIIMQTCADGSVIPATSICPVLQPTTQTCPDGSVIPTTQTCPDGSVIPTNSLSGLTAVADNFDPSAALQAASVPDQSPDWVGAFRMTCAAGQLLHDDPIMMPGQPGASHLHQFWGNTGANANSSYQSLRTSGDTTCGASGAPVNRTAYWMPAMLDGAGHAVKPDNIQIYYKQLPASSDHCRAAATACVGLPNSVRIIFGYNMKTGTGGPSDTSSADQWNLHYECWADDKGTLALPNRYQTIAAVAQAGCPAGSLLVIQFIVPGCWDGKNLDSADHRSHLSYGTPETGGQVCPADHPYLITAWQGNIRYTTDANFVAGRWHLSSDEMVPGAVAGSTLHLDYFEAWSPTVKATWQKNCIDGHLSCSDGQLGDGTMIKTVSLPAPHQLVTIQ